MSTERSEISELLARARLRHDQGDLRAARADYLEVLRQEPDHADALHLLGNIDARGGALADAERVIRKAIALAPEAPGYHISLGNVLRAAGRTAEAVEAYREELRRRPDFAVAHQQLGVLLMEQGEHTKAVQSLMLALRFAPQLAEAHNNLGKALNNLRKLDEAGKAFLEAIRLKPDFAEAYNNLGHVLRTQGEMTKAVECFREAVRLQPHSADTRHNLGTAHLAIGESAKAAKAFRETLRLDPQHAGALFNLGVLFHDKGMLNEAIECYRRALVLQPEDADTLSNLAAALTSGGRLEEAASAYGEALAVRADHLDALAGQAGVLDMLGRSEEALSAVAPAVARGVRHADVLVVNARLLGARGEHARAIDLIEAALTDTQYAALARQRLHFVLGDLYDALERHAPAFEHYRTANALKQTGWDPAGYERRVSRIIDTFDREALRDPPRASNEDETPVFILGMPRTGSSLVEQILASHPEVHGGGELNEVPLLARAMADELDTEAPYPEAVREASAEVLDRFAKRYLEKLHGLAPEARRITDKLWQNFEYLGLIELLFPHARVVHCVRDPLDTLVSCYFHDFPHTVALPFSYDLAHAGAFFRQYRRLMDHWREVSSLPVYELRYETLIADVEPVSRELLAFLGLEWDARCLRYFEHPRISMTASYAQVRQPIYTRAVGRARGYAPYLEALERALAASG